MLQCSLFLCLSLSRSLSLSLFFALVSKHRFANPSLSWFLALFSHSLLLHSQLKDNKLGKKAKEGKVRSTQHTIHSSPHLEQNSRSIMSLARSHARKMKPALHVQLNSTPPSTAPSPAPLLNVSFSFFYAWLEVQKRHQNKLLLLTPKKKTTGPFLDSSHGL